MVSFAVGLYVLTETKKQYICFFEFISWVNHINDVFAECGSGV
jgi:hypothetical protein